MPHKPCAPNDIALPEPTQYNDFIVDVAADISARSDQVDFNSKEITRSSDGVLIRLHQKDSPPTLYSISFLPFKSGPITSVKVETLACEAFHCKIVESAFDIKDISKVINLACELLEQNATGTFLTTAKICNQNAA